MLFVMLQFLGGAGRQNCPGSGFIDFHWYRKSREGFWGHKPGGTAARITDNSGHIIYNPQTANRGPYTIFCRYMYAQKRIVVR
jgi:hypothetical protein